MNYSEPPRSEQPQDAVVCQRPRPSPVKMLQLEKAFLDYGYAALTMDALAKACDLSRRALYYYFSNKEEAFRATCRFRNELALGAGFGAARRCWAKGGDALDIVSELFDVRYDDPRRLANASWQVVEISAEAFKRCSDIATDAAKRFEADLAQLLRELQATGILCLRKGLAPEQLARALADGMRGVNQNLPSVEPEAVKNSYREMCRFVLFGAAKGPAQRRRRSSERPSRARR